MGAGYVFGRYDKISMTGSVHSEIKKRDDEIERLHKEHERILYILRYVDDIEPSTFAQIKDLSRRAINK